MLNTQDVDKIPAAKFSKGILMRLAANFIEPGAHLQNVFDSGSGPKEERYRLLGAAEPLFVF